MKAKSLFVIIATALAFASPAAALDKRMLPVAEAKTQVLQSPSEGAVAEAELGRSMISFSRERSMPAIRIDQPVTSKEMGIQLTIPAGLLYLRAENPEGRFYEAVEPVGLISLGVALPGEHAGLYVPNDASAPMQTYRYMAFGPKFRPIGRIPFEPATYVQSGGVKFRVEYIYTGFASNVLSATYREFRDDMARPAFMQELKYDISQDKIIGFKGARIEVLSAGNTGIKYVVRSGFDGMAF